MEKLRRFVDKHFELFAILVIIGVMVLIDRFIVQKVTFLNFYYIPVLLAGYTQGKRIAGLTAVLCIASVLVCLMYDMSPTHEKLKGFALGAGPLVEEPIEPPPELPAEPKSPLLMQKKGAGDAKATTPKPADQDKKKAGETAAQPAGQPKAAPKETADKPADQTVEEKQALRERKTKARERTLLREAFEGRTEQLVYEEWMRKLKWSVYTHIAAWGGFLFLSGVLVGALTEEKNRRYSELRTAYVGILGIVSNYLETADKYMKGHLMRVSDLATDIARKLDMSPREVDCVHAAALLHDMARLGVNIDLIQRAAVLSTREMEATGEESAQPGSDVLLKMSSMLSQTVPILAATDSLQKKEVEGEGVPLSAQIVDIADCFDTMTSEEGKSPQDAVEEIKKSKSNYDEKLVSTAAAVLMSSASAGKRG